MQADEAPLDVTVVPALFEHAQRVYKEMAAQAKPDPNGAFLVYEGHLTNLFRKLRLSVPYYSSIKRRLVDMGCIEQLRRGGGTAESRWAMWKEPNLQEWKDLKPGRSERGNETSSLRQQIKVLHERISVLEAAVKAILNAERQGRSVYDGR